MKFRKISNREIRESRESNFTFVCFVSLVILFATLAVVAQQLPQGHATDFTSNSYYEPPHEQQVKMKLSGVEALPLPGGWLDVRQLKIETFTVDGKPKEIIRAPQCHYAPMDGVAHSAGHLHMQTADNKLRVEGEGFLWRQDDSLLIISNRVHTVIDLPASPPSA
jgi:hypothetical protein